MAGSNTPMHNAQAQESKQMSSRLLNMKFMQRASAISPASSTRSTPGAQARTSTTEPSHKRRRLEQKSFASSPASTALGTPRGGTSTFERSGDAGVDTEWTLDEDIHSSILNKSKASCGDNNTGVNGSTPKNGTGTNSTPSGLREHDSDEAEIEEDIWISTNPLGRQTFGAFRRRKTRPTTHGDDTRTENEEDLSSLSDSDASSDSGSGMDARFVPTRYRGHRPVADPDSDEEMRQVRQAIEQKYRNMAGMGPRPGGGGGSAYAGGTKNTFKGAGVKNANNGGSGRKRKDRDEGTFNQKKKARKTI